MKLEEIRFIAHNSVIKAHQIKPGMRVLESYGPNGETFIYLIENVYSSGREVTFEGSTTVRMRGETKRISNSWRMHANSELKVFFETIERALELGIKEKDIETS